MGLCLHPWATLSSVKLPHEAWLSNVQKVPRRCGSAGDAPYLYLPDHEKKKKNTQVENNQCAGGK